MRNARLFRTLEAGAVLLFFVQSVRVLFSVLFGLIYDTIFTGVVALSTLGLVLLCVVVALLSPLFSPRRNRRALLSAAALIAALARVPLTLNMPIVRLWSSLVVIGAVGVYAVVLLRRQRGVFAVGLALAFAADQLMRAAGNTLDVGLRSWWLPVQGALSLATCAVAWVAFSRSDDGDSGDGGLSVVPGLAVGALLFLETSLLGFPNALARWSGVGYAVTAPLLMLVTLLAVLPGVQRATFGMLRGGVGGLGVLLLAVAGVAAGRVVGGAVGLAGMLAAQFFLLGVLCGLPGPRGRERSGLALTLGLLLFLALNFAAAFAFTYPYTVSALRDKGLYVFLVATVVACLPALRAAGGVHVTANLKGGAWPWLLATCVVLVTGAFAWPPALNLKAGGPIRVGTYNIHYGYNTTWQLSLEAQARTIEESGADIVVLQEVDACRVTSYGVDDALWLARRLGMQEVYGPTLEGLSGIALLTRVPIAEADTRLLSSELEQTAIVHARVVGGDGPLDAYGVWMGLEPEERARQLDDALVTVGAASPAVIGGDFNSSPDSPIYARIQAAGFSDPFVVGGFDPAPTSPAIQPVERIDFVWARGLDVRDAQVLSSLASDHRMVVAEFALP